MNVYICSFKDNEWCCFVASITRNKAKSSFYDYWKSDGDYTDVRCCIVMRGVQIHAGVYDVDCADLDKLGLHYTGEDTCELTGKNIPVRLD